MNVEHFNDLLIHQILCGLPLTPEEREFLVTDTVTFEECYEKETELRKFSDRDLMKHAYTVWCNYASGQTDSR